jgi:replicative DNA helicase
MYINSIQHIEAINQNKDLSESEKIDKIQEIINSYKADKKAEFKFTEIKEYSKEAAFNLIRNIKTNQVIPTRYKILDGVLSGGLIAGEFVVIGGRPGTGKTLFSVNLALNFSVEVPVLFFSYDLSINSLVNKFISSISDIPFIKLQTNTLRRRDRRLAHASTQILNNRPIYLCTDYNDSIPLFIEYCKNIIIEKGIKVIIIDTINLMHSSNYANDRKKDFEYICSELKDLAHENNVLVIANTQLSKMLETRNSDFRPKLRDLRGYSSFEQFADKIFFIYRPGYYQVTEDEYGNSIVGMVELILATNKLGHTDSVWLKTTDELTNICNYPDFAFEDFLITDFSQDNKDETKKEEDDSVPF